MPQTLVLLIVVVVGVVAGICLACWIVYPLESLAKSRQAPLQFALSDLLILFAMLQSVVGTVHYLIARETPPGPVTGRQDVLALDGCAALVVALFWWYGLEKVSRAGVRHWWHRVVVLLFVAPCALACTAATIALTGIAVSQVPRASQITLPMIGLACAILAVAGVAGTLTRWIVAKYPPGETVAKEVPQPGSSPFEE